MEGAVNVDGDPRCEPDVVADLTNPLPFESGTFDRVWAKNVLEHVFNYESLMIEFHRVMKRLGDLFIQVPLMPSRVCFAGHGHVRQFVPESLMGFCNPRWYQPRTSASDTMGLFDLVAMKTEQITTEREAAGTWIAHINAHLRKADKQYWIEQGVHKDIGTEVHACFWCQRKLRKDGNMRICDHCGGLFEIREGAK